MIPLAQNNDEFTQYLKSYKSRAMVPVRCVHCNKVYERMKCYFQSRFGVANHRQNLFCSSTCSNLSQTLAIVVECLSCAKPVKKKLCHIKKAKGNPFCSSRCAAHFNNKKKRKSKRSKCEILLAELLVAEFPGLIFIQNDKTMLDGMEVDIAIPELKMAIEWNGIVHFKPIYGHQKLQKIKSRDFDKQQLAYSKGISLIIVTDLVSTKKYVYECFQEISKLIRENGAP